MNERIKELRKYLGLTLEKFGARLGVKRSTVCLWENGDNSISESIFLSIIREFHVNESWLRDGVGEMFVTSPQEEEVIYYTQMLLEDENDIVASLIKNTVVVYEQLDPASKEIIKNTVQNILERTKKDQP